MFTMDEEGSPDPAPPTDGRALPLAQLPVGGSGRIVSVDVSAVDLQRLEVMGLCGGRMVCVIKHGDPMIVRVLGTRIGLAAALARSVHVLPETFTSSSSGKP